MPKKKDVNLEQRLLLNSWMNSLFGYTENRELLRDFRDVDESYDAQGKSSVYWVLTSRSDKLDTDLLANLETYEDNIRAHLEKINRRRAEPVTLRYFQHLALLYTEVFLDRWSSGPASLVRDLNRLAQQRKRGPESFTTDDLGKLAFWMATGGGKTLIMHANYYQFLHYNRQPLDNILLITPNEDLTAGHLEDMRLSGIPCERFTIGESGLGLAQKDVVRATEITKLTEEKKGQGISVDVESFEGRNLIFVDEGHRGAASDDAKAEKSWRPLRERLAEQGFTFEYSATFGQAVQASKSEKLAEEYGKAILFDYSYRHFYDDGYGKDFEVFNLKNQTDGYTDLLLLGNLLSFYEQRRFFSENPKEAEEYNLKSPLWIFVGSKVNAVYQRNNQRHSDVLIVLRFLHRFLENEQWAVEGIGQLLGGESGLLDADGKDAFEEYFKYLKKVSTDPVDVFDGILQEVFHARAGGTLRVSDIKGAEGELGLKVAGPNEHFGLVYIGDTSAFKDLLEENEPKIAVEEDVIAGSLFEGIEKYDSPVNLLIGSKKFTEGWSSWRVSTMGLLNIGKSEGSQIIQLFGRGVRLKGRDLLMKRSSALDGPPPPGHLELLETLNVFAVEANYMAQFREYLEREGVDPGGYEEIPLPIQSNESFINRGLLVPRMQEGEEFVNNERFLLDTKENLEVNLDLSVRTEILGMGEREVETESAKAGERRQVASNYLSMLDWEAVYLDLLEHKERKGFHNLVIPADKPREIMEQPEPVYRLVADGSLVEPQRFEDMARLQEAVQAILRKYVETFYRARQQRWDTDHMEVKPLSEVRENFADYTVRVRRSKADLMAEVEKLVAQADEVYKQDLKILPTIHFDHHLYQPLLIKRGDDIKSTPPGLEKSEENFVSALRGYFQGADLPSGKEVFLLRNLSRGKGIGFFNTAGFYPDFILWVKDASGPQKVVFVEPHGMHNDDPPPYNPKVDMYLVLKDLSDRIAERDGQDVFLDSYIISATPYSELNTKWGEGWTRDRFAKNHVLFEDDLLDTGIPALIEPRDELEPRISTSYPYPLASGFRSLVHTKDLRDLYREQLRFAENILAFLASVSLALLKEEDVAKMDIDPEVYWRGGISPGHWRDIVGRCSKIFASYQDFPLAVAIQKLNIRSEKKGFGHDIARLIQMKNDYKHDRGPTEVEEIQSASNEVEERLRRCMEALSFFTDHPISQVEDCSFDQSNGEYSLRCIRYVGDRPNFPREKVSSYEELRGEDLFLDAGGGSWISLHPFIVPMTCSRCEVEETYFVDAWDRKKNTARMKSFELGHTTPSREVSETLERVMSL